MRLIGKSPIGGNKEEVVLRASVPEPNERASEKRANAPISQMDAFGLAAQTFRRPPTGNNGRPGAKLTWSSAQYYEAGRRVAP